MRPNSILCVTLAVVVAIAVGTDCLAQEVGSVDLTKVKARTDLRRPPLTKKTSGARGGIKRDEGCFDSTKNVGALRTQLISLDRTHYQIGDEPIFEVTVENVDTAPLRIPFSPHLADLQPKDPAQKFSYSELHIVLWIAAGDRWSANTGGSVVLYGDDDHPATMLPLSPGEWAQIVGKGKFSLPGDQLNAELMRSRPPDLVYAEPSLYREETLITATQSATLAREVCIAKTRGQSVPIQLTVP